MDGHDVDLLNAAAMDLERCSQEESSEAYWARSLSYATLASGMVDKLGSDLRSKLARHRAELDRLRMADVECQSSAGVRLAADLRRIADVFRAAFAEDP